MAFADSKNCWRLRFVRQIYATLICHRKTYTGPVLCQQWAFRGICWKAKGAKTRTFLCKLLTIWPHFFLPGKTSYKDSKKNCVAGLNWKRSEYCTIMKCCQCLLNFEITALVHENQTCAHSKQRDTAGGELLRWPPVSLPDSLIHVRSYSVSFMTFLTAKLKSFCSFSLKIFQGGGNHCLTVTCGFSQYAGSEWTGVWS